MKKPSETKLDPYFIFLQGNAFFQANHRLHASPTPTYDLRIPACTLSAFSCELFFKCLVCIETGAAPKGHNLRKLFDALQSSTKRELESLWSRYAVAGKAKWDKYETQNNIVIPRDLLSALSAGAIAFEGFDISMSPQIGCSCIR